MDNINQSSRQESRRPLQSNFSRQFSPFTNDQPSAAQHGSNSRERSYGHGQSLRRKSPEAQEDAVIEQRHEELKRQIAQKERQLAQMTGERDTADRLRQRLGLQNHNKLSGRSLMSQEKKESRNTFSSASPHNDKSYNGMVGMRSSHLRQNSATGGRDDIPQDSQIKRLGPRINVSSGQNSQQQLQFNPTRLTKPQQSSPLRNSRSKSGGYRPEVIYEEPSERNNAPAFQRPDFSRTTGGYNLPPRDPNTSNYRSNSPLRASKSRSPHAPIREDSSRNFIKPVPIQNNQSSGRLHQRNYSFAPQSNNNADVSNLGQRDMLYKDRIEAMTADNQSLQRRLNQVTQELERIKRERDEFQDNLAVHQSENTRLDEILNSQDPLDMQNYSMKDELQRKKDENSRLTKQVQDYRIENGGLDKKLTVTVADKKNLGLESDNLKHEIGIRIRRLDEVSRERQMIMQKLQNTNNEIEKLQREELQINHENIDLEQHVARLMHERQELLKNLQDLTRTFDECVRDITRERRNMDGQNDWQTKLIVAKIMFEDIERFQMQRQQNAFTEMTEYCRFDKECHTKLRSFSNVLTKLGHFKMKIAINQWYTLSLKPLQTRLQNDDISIVIDCNRLQAKVFYAWRQYQRDKMDCYQFKTNAIERMCSLLVRGSKCELKRAVSIWKEKLNFESFALKRFKDLVQKRNNQYLSKSIQTWRTYSNALGHAVRVRVLQIECSQKLYLSQVFSQMKFILRNEKRKRIRCLNQFVKAWQDYVIYNRHLMQANMAAISFGKTNQEYLVRSVFDALRQNSEIRKHTLLRHAVSNDIDVAIAETDAFNREKNAKIKNRAQMRAGTIVSMMLGRKLFAFFNHWRNVNKQFQITMGTKVQDQVIKMYSNYIQSYFDHWKDGLMHKERRKRIKMLQEQQSANEQLQNEALQGEKQLRVQDEGVRSSKRRMVDKTFRKLFYRKLAVAMGRWKDICNFRNAQEDKAALVIKKMRKRFLRQAFDMYLQFYKKSGQHIRNVKSAEYMRETLDKRTLRKHFNALCFHTNRQNQSKKYWLRILGRMDAFMKKRAIQIWSDNAHLAYQESLQGNQDQQTEEIFQQNERLSKLEQEKLEQQAFIDAQMKLRKKKAYRQIGNYFMRNYAQTIFWKFKTWKDNIHEQKHKEKILRKTFDHQKRVQLESVRRVFIKFMSDDRKREALEKLKQLEIEQNELQTKIKFNKDKQDQKRKADESHMVEQGGECKEQERKIIHVMNWLERNNRTRVFCSKKRMVFTCWRHAVKQQKAFLLCVENVLNKSMLDYGLRGIKSASRDIDSHTKVERALKRFLTRCFKNNASNAFTRWKASIKNSVSTNTTEVVDTMQKKNDEFLEFVDRTKEANNARCFGYFQEKNKLNLWRAWNNVIKNIKLTKAKTVEFKKRALIINRKDCIKLWKARVERTKQCRAKEQNLVRQFRFKYYRAAFQGLKKNWKNTTRFVKVLSNLERMYRERNYECSFKSVRTYAVSKGLVLGNKRMKGTEDLVNLVKQQYLKNLQKEFLRYKNKAMGDTQKRKKLKACWGKVITARMRDSFLWWKRRSNMAQLKIDLNDSGPERAQYWQAMREIENLKDFLRSEHYTENEVEGICEKVFNKNHYLMRKYMIRMRLRQDKDIANLPHIWNRWKDYVAIRKLIKYQFQYMHNRVNSSKVDLQRAFRIWRNGPEQLNNELWKLPVNTLIKLAANTTLEVQNCGDNLAENNSIQNHLMMQRDEFLNYYIKGQVLAMALLKDRNKFAEMQAISRWLTKRQQWLKDDKERQIRDNEYLLANLEQKKIEFAEANVNLTKENGDLGGFAEDGKIIRKNMDKLVEETTKIKTQIHETDDDLAELLANNERLQKEIAEVQGKVNEANEQGLKSRFKVAQETNTIKAFQKEESKETIPNETKEQKQKRERFERLNKLSQGAGLR